MKIYETLVLFSFIIIQMPTTHTHTACMRAFNHQPFSYAAAIALNNQAACVAAV